VRSMRLRIASISALFTVAWYGIVLVAALCLLLLAA
jgi:hypothetical protein